MLLSLIVVRQSIKLAWVVFFQPVVRLSVSDTTKSLDPTHNCNALRNRARLALGHINIAEVTLRGKDSVRID